MGYREDRSETGLVETLKTQAYGNHPALAKAAGVSVSTVHKFETGTITNMNITNLMALLRQVGLLDRFDDLIPEQPENPYLTSPEHQQQRVKRKNNG